MRLRILGPLQFEDESGHVVDLGPPRQRALLALLAINPNSVLSTERIIEELWGDHPPTDGPRNISVYVSRLRAAIEPGRPKRAPGKVIVTEPSGYSLRIDPNSIDAQEFERLVGEARARMESDPETARSTVEVALERWRDHPLAGLEYEEFAQAEIRRLEELHLQALELRAEASIRMGEADSAVPELEKLVAANPLRERLVALLMEALAAAGRQAEALRTYRTLAVQLGRELGLEPSAEVRRLEERILLQSEAEPPATPSSSLRAEPGAGLPARLTSLVGREDDLTELAGVLRQARLVTLTGPGGVGKSSLAIEAARDGRDRYPAGVWLVDLSPLHDPDRCVVAVADAVGVKDEPGVPLQRVIAAALGRGGTLLVLDNCEHLVDAVSSLSDELLRAQPELTVLCTSRRSLGVDGETVYEVTPLPLPSAAAGLDELRESPAARLLSDRAAAASPGFVVTDDNADAVAGLCRGLDGIPLAIELAASNLRSMTITEITESLRDRISLRGRRRSIPRHRTLRATMQWSYDLLREREQELFDRLSVFAGRFSRSAALSVGRREDGEQPAGELAALVDASMIAADVSGPVAAYRMLPTMRDFGIFDLRERGELDSARRAHAAYLDSLASEVDLPVVMTAGTKPIEIHVSFEDFRAAADWAMQSGHTEMAMRLLVALGYHWINGGRLDEASHWLDRVHRLGEQERSMNWWKLRLIAAQIDWFAGRNAQAERGFRMLETQALGMRELLGAADARLLAGYVRWRRGDLEGARNDMAAAAETASGRAERSIRAREGVAVLELYLGNVQEAERHVEALEGLADETGDPIARCHALNSRGWLGYHTGDVAGSVRSFAQCRTIAAEEGDWHHQVNAGLGLAWVLPAAGDPGRALDAATTACDLAVEAANASEHGEALILMGCAQLDLGDLARAARSVADGLDILRTRVRRIDHLSRGLRFASWIAAAAKDADIALRFMTAAEAEHRRIGFVDPPADAARSARCLDEAAASLAAGELQAPTIAGEDAPFSEVVDDAVDYLRALGGQSLS